MMSTRYQHTAIRRLRKERKMRASRLAHLAKITPQALRFLETGRSTPRAKTLARLASALDAPISSFFAERSS